MKIYIYDMILMKIDTPRQMTHPYLIDTRQHFYRGSTDVATQTLKLQTLVKDLLGKSIQGTQSHDPSEDARYTLQLVQLKLVKGIVGVLLLTHLCPPLRFRN